MSELALQLIAENQRTKNPFLDLGNCGLEDDDFISDTIISESLLKCKHIESINLANRWYNYNKKISSWEYQSTKNDYWSVVVRNKLPSSFYGVNLISKIPSLLSKLPKLNKIIASYLYRDSGISLSLNNLSEFAGLKELYISENNIYDVDFIKYLRDIEILDLGSNNIRNISSLAELSNLKVLSLLSNKIKNIKPLEKLRKLQAIDLRYNLIDDISPLLNILKLGININTSLQKDTANSDIHLYKNPIINPPFEIVKKGREAIIRFFEGNLETKYEAKLLIVGEPESGKTTLRNRLIIPNYHVPNNTLSTIGIQVDKWYPFNPKDRTQSLQINIWDFGGQEIQYLTHQFFLTSDALYILLTSARKDLDNLDYWFNIIRLLGRNENNQNSKLLVVANEVNMEPIKHFVEKDFRERYNNLDFECFTVNLATAHDKDGRFQTLKYKIEEYLSQLPSMGRKLPVRWGVVRENLASRNENYVSIEKYLEICVDANLDNESAYDLSSYLHTIGEVIHFQNDNNLDDFIILNPKWAVDAVYVILKNNSIQHGHFTQQQVYRIWKENGYAKEEWGKLLRLMTKDNFEVCYSLPENPKEYISPQLLLNEQPNYEWNKEDTLKFRYSYPFMPKGILSRFIVRLHEDIEYREEKGLVWKSGVVLCDKYTGYLAQIRELEIIENGFKRKVIDIEIKGEKGYRKSLLKKVCKNIEKIHNDAFAGLPFERLVPCNCPDCDRKEDVTFYDYSELLKRYKKGKQVECKKDFREVNINDIFEEIVDLDSLTAKYNSEIKIGYTYHIQDPFQVKQNVNEIFFSYAWGDEKETGESREKIVNDLYESLKSDSYTVVIDKVELGYRGLISNFMGRIGKGDFVIVALTDKYFKSPYCMFELYEVYRNSKFEREEFIKKIYPIRVEKIAFDKPEIYIDYWKNEKQKLEEFIKKYLTDGIESKFKEFTQIQDITSKIGSILGILKDMNSLNKELLSKDNFAEIKKAIEDRTKLN